MRHPVFIDPFKVDRWAAMVKFARTLKKADEQAKAGRCREAAESLEAADDMGRYLRDALPNVRGEIDAKLEMVENRLASAVCKVRR